MHLVIDYGNTRTKVAVFSPTGQQQRQYMWEKPTLDNYACILNEYAIDAVIVCSVAAIPDGLLHLLHQRVAYVLVLDHSTPLPMQNGYKTPQTLGYDRLAVAVGANALHPNTPVLIIDAGTAITYDFVSPDNVYQGGNIAPGAAMRFSALHHFTHKLPHLSLPDEEVTDLLGDSTKNAIQLGIVKGIVFEMEGYIAHLKEKYPQLLIFLTGGDAFFFERRVKSSIFVSPNLLLVGLHRILTYNQCLQNAR